MARVTVEDCLDKVDNRFKLIHLAAKRIRQLRKGAEPLVVCKNKDVVVSLREIAAGKIIQAPEGQTMPGPEDLSTQLTGDLMVTEQKELEQKELEQKDPEQEDPEAGLEGKR